MGFQSKMEDGVSWYDLKLVGKNDVLLAFMHMPKHMGYGRVQIYALFFCQRS
jgi:hypothetical protein